MSARTLTLTVSCCLLLLIHYAHTPTVECTQYIREADSEANRAEYDDPNMTGGLVALTEAVADMLVRCDRQECMSRSVQQRVVADSLLQQHLLTEMPDFDYLWGIADMFKVLCFSHYCLCRLRTMRTRCLCATLVHVVGRHSRVST
jgi:hypothetical protein